MRIHYAALTDIPPSHTIDLFTMSPEKNLSIISYDVTSATMRHLSAVSDLPPIHDDTKLTWINVSGVPDVESVQRLGELYNIHQLSIEDILHTNHQPKIEIFENYRFLSIKTIQRDKNFHHHAQKKKKRGQYDEPDEFLIKQLSMIIMRNILITFHEIPGNIFEGAHKRILDSREDVRKTSMDYLVYTIIDTVVDEYFLALNHLEDDIEDFEERATKTSDYTFIEEIQDTKKYLLHIKRAISPVKDIITIITHHADFFQTDKLKPFLQDLHEHLNNATIIVENHREWLSNIMDVNISVLSYQMNKVMKVLAMISTIFIPLSFLAGVYGMNFTFMPELGFKWGYPVLLGGMGIIAAIMIIYFKIRRWF